MQEVGWAPGPIWTVENLAPPGFDPRTVQPVVAITTELPGPGFAGWKALIISSCSYKRISTADVNFPIDADVAAGISTYSDELQYFTQDCLYLHPQIPCDRHVCRAWVS